MNIKLNDDYPGVMESLKKYCGKKITNSTMFDVWETINNIFGTEKGEEIKEVIKDRIEKVFKNTNICSSQETKDFFQNAFENSFKTNMMGIIIILWSINVKGLDEYQMCFANWAAQYFYILAAPENAFVTGIELYRQESRRYDWIKDKMESVLADYKTHNKDASQSDS